MKFFIPHAKDKKEEEEIYDAIKKFAKNTVISNIMDRKIFSIRYKHDGNDYYAEVGKIALQNGEEVIAILESSYVHDPKSIVYLICTTNRGFLRGMPILVGKDSAYSVDDF